MRSRFAWLTGIWRPFLLLTLLASGLSALQGNFVFDRDWAVRSGVGFVLFLAIILIPALFRKRRLHNELAPARRYEQTLRVRGQYVELFAIAIDIVENIMTKAATADIMKGHISVRSVREVIRIRIVPQDDDEVEIRIGSDPASRFAIGGTYVKTVDLIAQEILRRRLVIE